MYLKNLSIRGFKSFADKTELEFRAGITAVVGPNGSGKSNISDAVRWVLGEQSVKQLRGGKMEDVIFAGTQFRKPVGQATVSLTLDNSCHTLDVPYNEVTVTRRLYRSGESEYLINNNTVRLRDIHELFMDTGIGREGYSMIGQGKIDAILSGKADERRGLVEEAAGITKFKSRKEEGEKKLKNAQDNLVRVEDILSTYEERIGPLKADKEKAEIFLDLSGEMKGLQIAVILQELEELEERNAGTIARHAELTAAFAEAGADKEAAEARQEELALALEDTAAEKARTREAYYLNKGQADEIAGEIALGGEKLRSLEERIAMARGQQLDLDHRVAETQAALDLARVQERELAMAWQSAEADHGDQLDKARELEAAIASSETESGVLKAKEEALRATRRDLEAQLSQRQVRQRVLINQQESLRDQGSNYEAALELNRQGAIKLEADLAGVRAVREKLAARHGELTAAGHSRQSEVSALRETLEGLRRSVRDAESRESLLKNLEESHEGYAKSVRDLFSFLKRTKSPHLADIAVLGDVIQTRPEYSVAVEAALGGYIGNIITGTDEQAKDLIDILKKQRLGRCTFLPRNVIKANRMALPQFRGVKVLGFASDLVETDPSYREIVDSILARTLIVRTMDDALLAARETGHRIKIVTLEGDMILGGGAMTGGSQKGASSGVVSRRAEIQTLAQTITQGRTEFTRVKATYDELAVALETSRHDLSEVSEALRQNELEETRLAERIDAFHREVDRISALRLAQTRTAGELEAQIALAEEQVQAAAAAIADQEIALEAVLLAMTQLRDARRALFAQSDRHRDELAEARIRVARREAELAAVRQEVTRLDGALRNDEGRRAGLELDIAQSDEQITGLQKMAQALTEQRGELLVEMQRLDRQNDEFDQREVMIRTRAREAAAAAETVRDEYYRVEKDLYKATMNLERFEGEKQDLIGRLNEDLDLTLAEARDLRQPLESKTRAKKRIAEIKGRITALGNVNLAAIEEYQKVSEHYEFLSTQRNDLIRSREELEELIREVTAKMRALFRENFVILSRNFKDTFRQLFNGGTAELILSDGDVLEGAIDINVQPPGKKLQNINLLSGGEKVLSAIALTFAILRMKPSPFCFLDEIEAALDDANVYRYATFIREFAQDTQFILITHRKGTMEAADILYGVTMEEKGISKIVSVDLEATQEVAV